MSLDEKNLANSHYGSLDVIKSSVANIHPSNKALKQQQQHIYQQPIKMDDLSQAIPPRPAIRQRQRVNNASIANVNNDDNKNNDLSKITNVVKQDEQIANNDTCIIKGQQQQQQQQQQQPQQPQQPQQQQLNDELIKLNKSFVSDINMRPQSESFGSKGLLTLQLPSKQAHLPERPYPKKVLFIAANEFCERFSFYGFRTILTLYFINVLGFTKAESTISFHLFTAVCYVTPILGAILGDSIWGKFKTIFYMSIIYFMGELLLVISAIYWDLGNFSRALTIIGLLVIGLGTGGIKPCVSALGGDQFYPHEEKWRQGFFSLFYACINLGSLISMFITPVLRSDVYCVHRQDCYPLAFGLPCLLMLIAIIVFVMGKNQYHEPPLPEQNVIVAFSSCIWLALKRKLTGYKLPESGQTIQSRQNLLDTTSSSSLSVSSNEEVLLRATAKVASIKPTVNDNLMATKAINESHLDVHNQVQAEQTPKHWLYLASDRFDHKSIEDFRSVLGVFLVFLFVPIFWSLYEQQGSLWTLQAIRMDGHIFNTNFVLEPDQISVANPLIMLGLIPVFEILIYPSLGYCNLLTKPIQRMTVGGFLTAAAFVMIALIEVGIQHYEPVAMPPSGKANLLLVNGLSECSLINPVISYVPQIHAVVSSNDLGGSPGQNVAKSLTDETSMLKLTNLEPLSAKSHEIISSDANSLNNYQLKFKLGSINDTSTSSSMQPLSGSNESPTKTGCPLSATMDYDLAFGPFSDKSTKLVYLDQGNGKLSHKVFDESMALPPAGKARLRLLYEGFGSAAQREKRQFYLLRDPHKHHQVANNDTTTHIKQETFKTAFNDGQVTLSDYLDVDVSSLGEFFLLRTNDNLLGPASNEEIFIKPGTRNLIIVHQKDSQNVEMRLELLQDNNYRISMLYQLVPYLLISMGEVMFSITGLEFCYSMAPDNMKSIILAAWSLTIALGSMFTVTIQAMHLFSNMVHSFLFYAAVLTIDMIGFALVGYYYVPYKPVGGSNN